MVEGTEPPPPLPEGTGCLPMDSLQASSSVPSRLPSSGGASPSESRVFAGSGPSAASSGYHAGSGSGYHGGAVGSSPTSLLPKQGFGNFASSDTRPRDGDDFFTGVLGSEVGSKVSGGFWTALGATKKLA